MGMFDTFMFEGGRKDVACAAGHPYRELQTKDLESFMETYYVVEGRAYEEEDQKRVDRLEFTPDTNDICRVIKLPLKPCNLTGQYRAYNSCYECKPVEYRVADASNCTRPCCVIPLTRQASDEFTLEFRDGKLVDVKSIVRQSREDIVDEVEANGHIVIA